MVSKVMREKYGTRIIGGESFHLIDYHTSKIEAHKRAKLRRDTTGVKARVFKGKHPEWNTTVWLVYITLTKRQRKTKADKIPRLLLKEVTYSKQMSEKEHESWRAFWYLKGVWYEVIRSGTGSAYARGTAVSWFRCRSKKRAIAFFKSHPKAISIQKYKGKVTAGRVEVFPKTIKVNGKTYSRAYAGPHTKKFAESCVRGFRKEGKLKAVVRRAGKHGWLIFVR